jgi:dipeptidase D
MVCEKTPDSVHDFNKDGIEIIQDGDIIRANGTSLGADNGIGMAMLLQILAGDFAHPPITALFTSDEERGLAGVKNLDLSLYDGNVLINLDSEEEGVFFASCAGGVRCAFRLSAKKTAYKKSESARELRIAVHGLKGGHSGLEIDKEHANAILLLERILRHILKSHEFFLLDISGGGKENSIPANAYAVIAFDAALENAVKELVAQKAREIKAEYAATDPDIQIETAQSGALYDARITRGALEALLALLTLLPNGLIKKDLLHNTALTSSNLGVLRLEDENIVVSAMIRSNIDSAKYHTAERFSQLARLLGMSFELINDYPAWEYNSHSKTREIFTAVFESEFGHKPNIKSIHGGLECAYFAQKRAGLDMISLGCNLYDVHSVNERFNLSSAVRTYKFLKTALERMAE